MTLDQIVDAAVDMLLEDEPNLLEDRATLRALVADSYRRRAWSPEAVAKLTVKDVRSALRAGMRRHRDPGAVVTAKPGQVSPRGKGYVPTVGEWVQ